MKTTPEKTTAKSQYEVNESKVFKLKKNGLTPAAADVLLNRMNIADSTGKHSDLVPLTPEGQRGGLAGFIRKIGIMKLSKLLGREIRHEGDCYEICPTKHPVVSELEAESAAA